MNEIEKRTLPEQLCELRSSVDGDGAEGARSIGGYAAVFNTRSALLGGTFIEQIATGAFDDVMGDDVRALFNHDPNFVLGRTVSKTLVLSLDTRGLSYTINPPDTQTVRDMVLAPIARGDVSGSSFRFRVAEDGDEWRQEGQLIVRTIHRFQKLIDVSPVTYPAYDESHVAQRSLDAWRQTQGGEELARRVVNQRLDRERFLDIYNA